MRELFLSTKKNNYRPWLLKLEFFGFLITVLILSSFIGAQLGWYDVNSQIDTNSLLYLHNRERLKYNLGTLSLNSKLGLSAEEKAGVMLDFDCWDHYCPPGTSPWKTFKQFDYEYLYAGENLAEGFTDNAIVFRAWMNSPTHRANIVKPQFTEIGFGYATGFFQKKNENTIIAVHFGHPVRKIQVNSDNQRKEVPLQDSNISVVQPLQGESYSNQFLSIEGNVLTDITRIDISNGQETLGSVQVESNFFSYSPEIPWPIGESNLELQGYNLNGELISKLPISFIIDNLEPYFDSSLVQILEITRNDNVNIDFGIILDEEISEAQIKVDGTDLPTTIEENTIEFSLGYENLKLLESIELTLIDKPGNTSVFRVDSSELDKLVQEELKLSNIPENSLPLQSMLGVAHNDTGFSLNSLDFTQWMAILGSIGLISLLVIDHYRVKKHNIDGNDKIRHHHLQVGVFLVLIIFILMASGVGNILTGIAS